MLKAACDVITWVFYVTQYEQHLEGLYGDTGEILPEMAKQRCTCRIGCGVVPPTAEAREALRRSWEESKLPWNPKAPSKDKKPTADDDSD